MRARSAKQQQQLSYETETNTIYIGLRAKI